MLFLTKFSDNEVHKICFDGTKINGNLSARHFCPFIAEFPLAPIKLIVSFAYFLSGASKEIGTALTRVCLRHKAVETRMKTFTTAIMDSLIIPLQVS